MHTCNINTIQNKTPNPYKTHTPYNHLRENMNGTQTQSASSPASKAALYAAAAASADAGDEDAPGQQVRAHAGVA
jgi:hypothetical protein